MHKKVNLNNGIPVVMIPSRDVRSICIGIWVRVGSRHENSANNGISHFLEHMFFKGTDTRTAKDIAMEIDSMGGELNAFTTSESTTYYIKTLDAHMEKAINLLTDIFLNSSFPEPDIEKEKNIITEEIKMVEDTPSDYIHELFSRSVWGQSGLGHSVLGIRETIRTFTHGDLINHVNTFYGKENIIVACSGNFKANLLVETLNRSIGNITRSCHKTVAEEPEFRSTITVERKELSESHICLGLKGIPYGSDDRYSMYLLNTILGSGFSSRLFQEVREKRGLAYSIYSYNLSYSDTALWGVYAGTDKKHIHEVIEVTATEMRTLSDTITGGELQRAKDQVKGNLILALESTSNRMLSLAKQEMYYGRYYTPEEIMLAVDSVTLEAVKRLSRRLVTGKPFALTVYGPAEESEIEKIETAVS